MYLQDLWPISTKINDFFLPTFFFFILQSTKHLIEILLLVDKIENVHVKNVVNIMIDLFIYKKINWNTNNSIRNTLSHRREIIYKHFYNYVLKLQLNIILLAFVCYYKLLTIALYIWSWYLVFFFFFFN